MAAYTEISTSDSHLGAFLLAKAKEGYDIKFLRFERGPADRVEAVFRLAATDVVVAFHSDDRVSAKAILNAHRELVKGIKQFQDGRRP